MGSSVLDRTGSRPQLAFLSSPKKKKARGTFRNNQTRGGRSRNPFCSSRFLFSHQAKEPLARFSSHRFDAVFRGRRRRSQSRGDQLIVVAGVARGRIPIEKKRREGTRRNKKENQDGGFHCQTDDGQPAQRRQRSV